MGSRRQTWKHAFHSPGIPPPGVILVFVFFPFIITFPQFLKSSGGKRALLGQQAELRASECVGPSPPYSSSSSPVLIGAFAVFGAVAVAVVVGSGGGSIIAQAVFLFAADARE